MPNNTEREEKVEISIEIAIKVGLLFLVLYITYLIAKPFIGIVVWGIIIAVALSPVINSLEKRFANRKKIIIALTVGVIVALIVPTYMLSGSVIEASSSISEAVKEGSIIVPPPTENVKEWPLIGKKAYAFWDAASHNLKTALTPYAEQIKSMAKKTVSLLTSGLGTIFMFIGSMIIAAVFLIGSEGSVKFYNDILRRLVGDKGKEWANLSALTVRSVVLGVLGVAVIQAFFALIGMVAMGIPLAIVWAIAIMFKN